MSEKKTTAADEPISNDEPASSRNTDSSSRGAPAELEGISSDITAATGLTEQADFRGNFEHALDEKGRINLPASFRQVLAERRETTIVLTNFVCDGARCLDGFSLSAWKAFEAKLAKRSRFDAQLRQLENFYIARATHCQVDSSGRINIPQYLRTYAGLRRDVTFTAAMHGFRVWDSKVWEMVFREAETALLADPNLFIDVDR